MTFSQLIASCMALVAVTSAQVVSYQAGGNIAISVNVPQDTAQSGNGPIYLQLSAPSGTQWVGFGQGQVMAGANMLVMYAQSSSNVTVSPRLGTGERMPEFNSDAQITVLEGTGIHDDGSMVANIRCDSCINWNGGSLNPTDSSSNWITAHKNGDPLDSSDTSETIVEHDVHTQFTLDLTQGTGGNSANPFIQSNSAQASGTQPSNPLATGGSSSGSMTVADPNNQLRLGHGVLMSVLFLAVFPFTALTLYLPFAQRVRFVHAPLQLLGTILLIVGMALGILLGTKIQMLDRYHQVIGFIVVCVMVLFQPAMGIYQHLHYRKTGGRSSLGVAHRWLGRLLMALGIINGGLGYHITGNTGAYAPYGVVAALVFLIYVGVVAFDSFRNRGRPASADEKRGTERGDGYEMSIPKDSRHNRIPSDVSGQVAPPQQYQFDAPERR